MPERTPIFPWHQQHGGKLVEFAGWELPVSYEPGIVAEHLACRKQAGLFDVSHMGRFVLDGPRALEFLCRALTGDARRLTPGRAQYTLISDPQGRPLDDAYLFLFRPGWYLLVVNGANRAKDWDWLQGLDPTDTGLRDLTLETAMFALQGPASEKILAALLEGGAGVLPPAGRNRLAVASWQGCEVLVSRTGYAGEPLGFELFVEAGRALEFWEAMVEAGRPHGLVPVGLGARDTLRLEACLPLYGHELRPDWPIMSLPQARFGVGLTPDRGEFVGKQALAAQAAELAQGGRELVPGRIMPVAALKKGMIREGSEVRVAGRKVGELTSGTMVPAWRFDGDQPGEEHFTRALGLAFLERDIEPGQEVEIIYRKRSLPGVVAKSFTQAAGVYLRPLQPQGENQ